MENGKNSPHTERVNIIQVEKENKKTSLKLFRLGRKTATKLNGNLISLKILQQV